MKDIPAEGQPVKRGRGRPRKERKQFKIREVRLTVSDLREVLQGPINHRARTPARAKKILAILAQGYSIPKACKAAGISESTFHVWRREDAGFRSLVEEAQAQGVSGLEDLLTKRAVHGQKKFATYMGKVGDSYIEVDNSLLKFALQARHPAYRVTQQTNVQVNLNLADRLSAALARAKMNPSAEGAPNEQ